MTTRTRIALAIGAAALTAGAAPIAGQMTHMAGADGTHAVTINDAGYLPADMVVAPGQHIVFRNVGINPHTVTSSTGAFASGTLNRNDTYDLTAPAATGVYPFSCIYHVNMRGTVRVSTLTLDGPASVRVGRTATVRGSAPGTPAGTPVTLERLVGAVWTPIGTTAIGADGTYTLTTPALTGGAQLRMVAGAEVSPTLVVPVAPRVTLTRARRAKLTLTVALTPRTGGAARLERFSIDSFRWSQVKRFTLPRSGRATVKVPGAGRYRVTVLAKGDLAQSSSPAIAFR